MYKVNDIVVFKVASGEEMIAKYISEDSQHFTVNHPLSIVSGPQGFGVMPALITGKPNESVQINKSLVILHSLTKDDVTNIYIEATTGLKTPSSKILMG